MAAHERDRPAHNKGAAVRPSSRRANPRKAAAREPDDIEEVTARAARLGITIERVLAEYARIAFADLRHFVEQGENGVVIKDLTTLTPDDLAAIREFAPGADPDHHRVKFYDKKAALDAIARHLGMFPLPARRREQEEAEASQEDARDVLARLLARLAAGGAAT